MPTPSGNAPDPNPHSPRTFPFSSCPDAEDIDQQQQHHQQQQRQEQPSPASPSSPSSPSSQAHHHHQESESQSSWRPPSSTSPSPYNLLASPGDDPESPRSATMSPISSTAATPVASSSRDMEMTDDRRGISVRIEPEGMVLGEGEDDDDRKDADTDEDMVLGATSTARGDAVGGGTGAQRAGGLQGLREELIGSLVGASALRRVGGESSSMSWRRPDLTSPQTTADDGERIDGDDVLDTMDEAPMWVADTAMLGMGYEYADMRVIPISPSSYLRPGSRFHGTQQSERQRYDVQVEIKHVDLRESFLCGYLRIQGLTEDHPTLTTYFEGEIIGTKYGFTTQHPSWGASDKTDLSHWGKFQAFRPFQKQMKKGSNVMIKDVANRENIFMRWKEQFLVPDHRVRTIHGASFEGFYYICFNQLRGEVSGIYFHSKSEKFQQLELKHVEDKGCYGSVEFR